MWLSFDQIPIDPYWLTQKYWKRKILTWKRSWEFAKALLVIVLLPSRKGCEITKQSAQAAQFFLTLHSLLLETEKSCPVTECPLAAQEGRSSLCLYKKEVSNKYWANPDLSDNIQEDLINVYGLICGVEKAKATWILHFRMYNLWCILNLSFFEYLILKIYCSEDNDMFSKH